MITVTQVGWSHYHTHEGPFFGGDFTALKVPLAGRDDSFASKVLAVTAAAEGGSWSSINMYDGGLVSVGALQFIDVAPQFGVTRMLGEVAERCGLDVVLEALKPALDLSNATFQKLTVGWGFVAHNEIVHTITQQQQLYFGDAQGNTLGSFTDEKRLIAKTWAACLANVWYIPGAVEAQSAYCLRRVVTDFVWGNLKADLFGNDVPDDGWIGATKAMLLSYAVNMPAIVVKQYDAVRSNTNERFSPEWCLEVLHGVVVNGGVDVWRARWAANMPVVERAFGVKLPSYAQLVARSWVAVAPTPAPAPEPAPTPDPPAVVDPPAPIVPPDPEPPSPAPEPAPNPSPPLGGLSLLLNFIKTIMEVVSRAFGRR